MGKTQFGWSVPYCPKCQKHTLKMEEQFGKQCPKCGTRTVYYHDYITKDINRLARKILQKGED